MVNLRQLMLVACALALVACGGGRNPDPIDPTGGGTFGKLESFSVTPDSPGTVSGGSIKLTANFVGSGTLDKTVNWKIVSGPGTISAPSGQVITYTAPLSLSTNQVVIEATPRVDPTKAQQIALSLDATTTIQAYVFEDMDLNGHLDTTDKPISGVKVSLTTDDGVTIKEATTDKSGIITFYGLKPQAYRLVETVPAKYSEIGATQTRRFPVTAGPQYLEWPFLHRLSAVEGFVYLDQDFDGQRKLKKLNDQPVTDDNGELVYDEPGVGGAVIKLSGTARDGAAVQKQVETDSNGHFLIDNLPAGKYTVTEEQPAKLGDWDDNGTLLFSTVTFTHNANSRADTTSEFTLEPARTYKHLWFAESDIPVSGLVFVNHGSRSGYRRDSKGEIVETKQIPNVTLTLTGTSTDGTIVNATTKTDKDGNFIFDRALKPGMYTLEEIQPNGYGVGHMHVQDVERDVNGKPINDADGKPINLTPVPGNIVQIEVPDVTKADSGDRKTPPVEISDTVSTLSGWVFLDDNNNGIFDLTEEGLVYNVPIKLVGTDVNGVRTEQTTTISRDGFYRFNDIVAGTYDLEQVAQPENYSDGQTRAGQVAVFPGGVPTATGTPGVNTITGIVIPAVSDGTGYTFAELKK